MSEKEEHASACAGSSTADDLELARQCVRGDEQAWQALLARSRKLCFAIARRRGLEYQFDDVFSDYVLKLLGTAESEGVLAKYSGRAPLSTFLSLIFLHVLIDRERKRAQRKHIDTVPLRLDDADQAAEDGYLHLDRRENESLEAAVDAVVAALPEQDRMIVQFYYFNNWQLRRIADAMNCSEARISRRLSRLREELRPLLARVAT